MATVYITHSNELQKGNKISAIKDLRTALSIGLKEAKEAIEDLPCHVEIPAYLSTPEALQNLSQYGITAYASQDVLKEPGTPVAHSRVETAFKNFLKALIDEGQYDRIQEFVRLYKQEPTGRRLEI